MYSENYNLYGLWVTLNSPDWVLDNNQGIAITIEMSSKPNRVDFSDISTGLPAPYNSEKFQQEIHFSDSQLVEPILRLTIDSFVSIMDMMRDLNMTSYSFFGDNQVLIDGLGASVPTTGNLLECKSMDGETFSITVTGPLISREYWYTAAQGAHSSY